MRQTVGKRLSTARLARGLSIDEAAHATRMRPDKILALENDDFSRFANHAYAKGFLLIYSRLLKVDASEEARLLEAPQKFQVREYQYLDNAPAPTPRPSKSMPRFAPRQKKPSVAPLLFFVVMVMATLAGFYLYVTAQRISSYNTQPHTAPTPAERSPANPGSAPEPIAENATSPAEAPGESAPGVPRAEPHHAAAVPPVAVNEVLFSVRKKTWVTIRKNDPNSRPIFTDYLYPDVAPLKLRGERFFIEPRDPAALEIRKNGVPIAYQPGISIQ